MKKTILAFLCMTQLSYAGNIQEVASQTIKPSELREIMAGIVERGEDAILDTLLTAKQTEEINWYMNQDDSVLQLGANVAATPAAAAAGAAGGAAAALVDYAWDRYVGNRIYQSQFLERVKTSDGFDIQRGEDVQAAASYVVVNDALTGPVHQVTYHQTFIGMPPAPEAVFPAQAGELDSAQFLNAEGSEEIASFTRAQFKYSSPKALGRGTPAAVAGAAAGALAYKVVRHGLDKYGRISPRIYDVAPNHFDIH